MKKQAFLFLALALLVLAGGQKLFAGGGTETLTWDGRTLVVKSYSMNTENSHLEIDNPRFGPLYNSFGPAGVLPVSEDLDVVDIMDYDSQRKVIGKTTLGKIEKNHSYSIYVASNQGLAITGEYTDSESGFTAPVYYIIRGETRISFGTYQGTSPNSGPHWPDKLSIWFDNGWTTVYFDQAGFTMGIAEQFVDTYVMPMVNYDAMRDKYYEIRDIFIDYEDNATSDADREKRRGQCPESFPKSIGCRCKGDIVQHLINGTALGKGLVAGALAALPYGLGAIPEAIAENRKTKVPALLCATIGYHYGWYPDENSFRSRFREDAIILFSGAEIPKDKALIIGSAAVDEVKSKYCEALLNLAVPKFMKSLSAIPGLGNILGFLKEGIKAAWEIRKTGDRAERYFKTEGPVGPNNWTALRPGTASDPGQSTFGTTNINGIAFGSWDVIRDINDNTPANNRIWVAVGDSGKMAYSSNGIRWTAVPPGTRDGQSSFGTTNINAVAFGGRLIIGGRKFIAVGNSGKMAYSLNGIRWTAIPPGTGDGQSGFPNNINIRGIADSGNGWVAVGDQSKTAYSEDNGTTWTAEDAKAVFAPSGGNTQIKDIAYGSTSNTSGRFVAVADNGRMAYYDWPRKSSSGNTVTPTPATKDDKGSGILGAIGNIIGGLLGGRSGHSYEVVDQQMTWEDAKREAEGRGGYLATITSEEENAVVFDLVSQGNLDAYWLGGQADSDRAWSWVTGERFTYTNWGGRQPDATTSGSGRQDKITIRTDSRYCDPGQWDDNWNTGRLGFVIEWDKANGGGTTAAKDDKGGGILVAIGNIIGSLLGDRGDSGNWTAVSNSAFGTSEINGIAVGNRRTTFIGITFKNENRWVAVGNDGKIAYSSDGEKWTAVSSANNGGFGTTNINGVAYGNGWFVAVGNDGKMAFSTDGEKWTAIRNTGFANYSLTFAGIQYVSSYQNINDVVYASGRFVAVGEGGKMAYCDW